MSVPRFRTCACGRQWSRADLPRNGGRHPNQGPIPSKPLADAVYAMARRERVVVAGWIGRTNDPDDQSVQNTCHRLGIPERKLRRWATGETSVATADDVDLITTNSHLLWWDLLNEDTVRRPGVVAFLYAPRLKLNKARGERVKILTFKGVATYGDLGTDWPRLELVRRLFAGEDTLEVAA